MIHHSCDCEAYLQVQQGWKSFQGKNIHHFSFWNRKKLTGGGLSKGGSLERLPRPQLIKSLENKLCIFINYTL